MTGEATPETGFGTYYVVDPYFKNMPVLSLSVPRGWRASSAHKWAIGGDVVSLSD